MENIKQVIGKKLQDRRVEKGFKTQKALADSIGVDRTRVVRWESGENTPDPLYKELLCQKLDVPMSFFETIEIQNPTPAPQPGSQGRDALLGELVAGLAALDESELRTAQKALGDLFPSIASTTSTKVSAD